MKLRTTVGTIDGTPPGGIAEVPDNEAPGLIKSGIMSLPEEENSDGEDEKPAKATRSKTSKSTGDEDTEVSEDEAANTTKEG